MASNTAGPSSPLTLTSELQQATSPRHHLESAAMSMRPTTSSTGTTTTAGQDINQLDISSPHELTAFVDDVLARLENTFETMSSQVLDRLDTISKRIDNIELSISDLVQGNNLDVAQPSKMDADPSNT